MPIDTLTLSNVAEVAVSVREMFGELFKQPAAGTFEPGAYILHKHAVFDATFHSLVAKGCVDDQSALAVIQLIEALESDPTFLCVYPEEYEAQSGMFPPFKAGFRKTLQLHRKIVTLKLENAQERLARRAGADTDADPAKIVSLRADIATDKAVLAGSEKGDSEDISSNTALLHFLSWRRIMSGLQDRLLKTFHNISVASHSVRYRTDVPNVPDAPDVPDVPEAKRSSERLELINESLEVLGSVAHMHKGGIRLIGASFNKGWIPITVLTCKYINPLLMMPILQSAAQRLVPANDPFLATFNPCKPGVVANNPENAIKYITQLTQRFGMKKVLDLGSDPSVPFDYTPIELCCLLMQSVSNKIRRASIMNKKASKGGSLTLEQFLKYTLVYLKGASSSMNPTDRVRSMMRETVAVYMGKAPNPTSPVTACAVKRPVLATHPTELDSDSEGED
ncbi:hypothetical protein KIPB_001164 [Kipferlia bialata]|uniref:Uncharacterized protein n=1 Tax=Kipferlia bialata TaxID=797122 RepID=A0A9K3CND6_9EUKA|nr:hypothetical protein KIPB_001164 [Kipferlia bialata]|eukprot:g1164.t1